MACSTKLPLSSSSLVDCKTQAVTLIMKCTCQAVGLFNRWYNGSHVRPRCLLYVFFIYMKTKLPLLCCKNPFKCIYGLYPPILLQYSYIKSYIMPIVTLEICIPLADYDSESILPVSAIDAPCGGDGTLQPAACITTQQLVHRLVFEGHLCVVVQV